MAKWTDWSGAVRLDTLLDYGISLCYLLGSNNMECHCLPHLRNIIRLPCLFTTNYRSPPLSPSIRTTSSEHASTNISDTVSQRMGTNQMVGFRSRKNRYSHGSLHTPKNLHSRLSRAPYPGNSSRSRIDSPNSISIFIKTSPMQSQAQL